MSSSTAPHRLTNLPGYDDTARDIYETPDVADDASTTLTQQTSQPSDSSSQTSEDDEETNGESYGVSRRRLYPSRARERFQTVDTGGRKHVDLSDRVDGRRKGYKVRRRGSGEDRDEGLEARIARLRREIEECKIEAESELDFGGRDEALGSEIEGLGRVLAGIAIDRGASKGGQAVNGARSGEANGRKASTPGSWPDPATDANGEALDDEQMLRRVAGFDTRLAVLEQSLGISALDAVGTEAVTTPVLPSLTLLDQQMAALNSAHSFARLEEASQKIQQLRRDAESLPQSQSQSQSQGQPQSRPSTSASASSTAVTPSQPTLLDPDDMAKLKSLYALLPNLQSLTPTLPALLTRLRSLRTLHITAASAASDLDDIETHQKDMEKELKAWREGLEKVEKAVDGASENNGRNGKVVEGWVRELEGRVGKL